MASSIKCLMASIYGCVVLRYSVYTYSREPLMVMQRPALTLNPQTLDRHTQEMLSSVATWSGFDTRRSSPNSALHSKERYRYVGGGSRPVHSQCARRTAIYTL